MTEVDPVTVRDSIVFEATIFSRVLAYDRVGLGSLLRRTPANSQVSSDDVPF